LIEAGQVLTIPDVALKTATIKDEAMSAVTPSTSTNSIDGTTYTTVKGDHLWGIAVRAYGDGYSWVKVYTANKEIIGRNASHLEVGLTLTIPR
jgi:nucleoid-associated protein YgaU